MHMSLSVDIIDFSILDEREASVRSDPTLAIQNPALNPRSSHARLEFWSLWDLRCWGFSLKGNPTASHDATIGQT